MVQVYVSTPCYGGLCLQEYMESILGLQLAFIKNGHMMLYDTIENESLVHRGRNVSVGRFMQKSNADFFLFIDADIHFDPQSVIDLIKGDHDVAVGCYPKKYINWEQAAEYTKQGDERPMQMLSSSLVVNFDKSHMKVENDFVQILDGPTGFMLIKRKVFSAMEEKYPELKCANDHQNRDFDTYFALFDCMIDPVTKRYLSEDYAFCRRWQRMGGTIHAHIRTTLGHVGNLPFSGKLSYRLKDVPDSIKNENNNDSDNEKPVSVSENTSLTPKV